MKFRNIVLYSTFRKTIKQAVRDYFKPISTLAGFIKVATFAVVIGIVTMWVSYILCKIGFLIDCYVGLW